jgi:large subunit ribosomal protein L25
MKLSYSKRDAARKSESKKIRREGSIPAVLYSRGEKAETITVESNAFTALLRQVIPGRLSTTVFTLNIEGGKAKRAILKEIQYEPTTYDVIHLDFEELYDDHKVNVKVPIVCIGAAECPGIKLGGVLRQVIRAVPVSCLPKDMPEFFQLDVSSMSMRDARRLSDLTIPETVRPLVDLNEVAVAIVKR